MTYKISKTAGDKIAAFINTVDNQPTPYGTDTTPSYSGQSDTFCYAFVVDATGPVVASGSEYNLTEPVKCRRVVEDLSRQVIRIDTTGFDSIDIGIEFDGTEVDTVNPSSDTSATLTRKLIAMGATASEGLVAGKYIYISKGTVGTVTLAPNLATVASCSEWILEEEEDFFLSKVPSTDLQPGDLVEVHFSQTQGGVIVAPEVTVVADDCCTNRVVNNTNLQLDIPTYQGGTATGNTRTINTTTTWVAELKRDLTVEIQGGFARLIAGDYAMDWVGASDSWACTIDSELVFMTTSGVVLGTDLTQGQNATVNSAYLEMDPDDGAGNVSLSLVIDATITTI